jgi:Arc/MetJ family transcription regulator
MTMHDAAMRTTVTLDDDTAALLRTQMQERGTSFKQALNDAVRAGLSGGRTQRRFRTQTAKMGVPLVNLDRALALAAELEDEAILRKLQVGK